MVTYLPERQLVVCKNAGMAYVVYINAEGYLETVYYGRPLADYGDFDAVRNAHDYATYSYDFADGREERSPDGFKADCAPLEISPNGLYDKRGAPVLIRRPGGSFVTDFRFVSCTVTDGIPEPDGLPHALARGSGVQTAEFLLKESGSDVFLIHRLSFFEDKNVIVKSYEIENRGTCPVKLTRAMSMQFDLPGADYRVCHLHGRWSMEADYSENDVINGALEIASNYGRSSAEANPFIFLKRKAATYEQGEVVGFNLIYSGNFKFRVFSDKYGGTHVTYGINDEDFEWTLEPGGRFQTPQAAVAFSLDGIDGMSTAFHRFVLENVRRPGRRELLFNCWAGCHYDFDTDRLIAYLDAAKELGAELFVLDDGWFGRRSDDSSSIGDWQVNGEKFDLHRVIAHCRKLGMRFGIWFEPEMVSYDSDLFRGHPEYVLRGGADTAFVQRHQFHLDMSDPQVVACVYRQMRAFLEEYPVDYIKWDYNRIVAEHDSPAHPGRQGEVYHRLVLGYYALIGRLTREYPGIVFEGCASGGGRFDLGTLYYCPQIWASDNCEPAQRLSIQYNFSLGYPLACIGAHVNGGREEDFAAKSMLALFGTYGYELDPCTLSEGARAALSGAAALYREFHRDTVEEGTLWHLLSPNEGNLMCMQCVSADRSKSLIIMMSRNKEHDVFRYVRLKGLDADTEYVNDWDGMRHSGDYYMRVGLNFSRAWFGPVTAFTVTLRACGGCKNDHFSK